MYLNFLWFVEWLPIPGFQLLSNQGSLVLLCQPATIPLRTTNNALFQFIVVFSGAQASLAVLRDRIETAPWRADSDKLRTELVGHSTRLQEALEEVAQLRDADARALARRHAPVAPALQPPVPQ